MSAISSSFPCLLESNASNAKVVVFLVDHSKKNLQAIHEILNEFSPTQEDILLHENPENPPQWGFPVQSRSWEDPEFLENFKKAQKIFNTYFEVLKNFSNSKYSIKLKTFVAKEISKKAKEANIEVTELDEQKLFDWLNNRERFSSELNAMSIKLSDLASQLFQNFRDNFVIDTFPKRQTALISEIQQSLQYKRVFVICGSCHGNPQTSNFPEEASRLMDFLKAHTTFALFPL